MGLSNELSEKRIKLESLHREVQEVSESEQEYKLRYEKVWVPILKHGSQSLQKENENHVLKSQLKALQEELHTTKNWMSVEYNALERSLEALNAGIQPKFEADIFPNQSSSFLSETLRVSISTLRSKVFETYKETSKSREHQKFLERKLSETTKKVSELDQDYDVRSKQRGTYLTVE